MNQGDQDSLPNKMTPESCSSRGVSTGCRWETVGGGYSSTWMSTGASLKKKRAALRNSREVTVIWGTVMESVRDRVRVEMKGRS